MARTKIDPSLVPIMPAAQVKGTTTNDSAAAGYVGEVISAEEVSSYVNFSATGVMDDLLSISLTPGNWMISATACLRSGAGCTVTWYQIGISTTSGNDNTGLKYCGNNVQMSLNPGQTFFDYFPMTIPPYPIHLSTTTTYYYKRKADYTGTTPYTRGGIIQAIRVR